MDQNSSLGNKFDLNSESGVSLVLASIRASEVDSAKKNELRDLVFQYTNKGGDAEVRVALEEKLTAYGVEPIQLASVSPAQNTTFPFGSARPSPVFKPVSLRTDQVPAGDKKEKNTAEPKATPASTPETTSTPEAEVATKEVPLPTESKSPVQSAPTAPVVATDQVSTPAPAPAPETTPTPTPVSAPPTTPNPVVAEVSPTPSTATIPVLDQASKPESAVDTAPAPLAEVPSTPVSESAPAPAPTSTSTSSAPITSADRLNRIREIKQAVNSKVGNPVNLIDIANDVGREYMAALLDAMKKLNQGNAREMGIAMKRLEDAYAAVNLVIAQGQAPNTGFDEDKTPTTPTSPQRPVEPTPTPEPEPAPAPASVSTPAPATSIADDKKSQSPTTSLDVARSAQAGASLTPTSASVPTPTPAPEPASVPETPKPPIEQAGPATSIQSPSTQTPTQPVAQSLAGSQQAVNVTSRSSEVQSSVTQKPVTPSTPDPKPVTPPTPAPTPTPSVTQTRPASAMSTVAQMPANAPIKNVPVQPTPAAPVVPPASASASTPTPPVWSANPTPTPVSSPTPTSAATTPSTVPPVMPPASQSEEEKESLSDIATSFASKIAENFGFNKDKEAKAEEVPGSPQEVPAASIPINTPASPTASLGQTQLQSQSLGAQSIQQPINKVSPLSETKELLTPQDLPESKRDLTSADGVSLYSKEIDYGLEQLLMDWSLFNKSGMFGTGPKGREHPLFKHIANLEIPVILAGRFEGSTQEVKQSITDYMNGWRYEQGIIYEQGETFEAYLRRVIKHILGLQRKQKTA